MTDLQIRDNTDNLSELRIALLGCRYSGKSSAGNTILNSEEFELKRAAQCVERQRDALLLVLRVDRTFNLNNRKVFEGHLKLLSERVWRHTMVLFTYGDLLRDTPIEQHIESEGKELQWLVEKCGNRYHVLNNENRSDDTQVTELLEKMEKMVAANSGQLFQFPSSVQKEQITWGKGYPGMYEHPNMKRKKGSDDRFLESSHFGSTCSITSSNSSGYGSLFSIPASVLQRPNNYGTEAAPRKLDSTGAEFVDENRERLIQKIPSVLETTDCLKSKNMITDEMYSNIQTAKTSQEQMRILYRALDSGGTAVKAEFYEILKKKLPFLVDELEAGPSKA